MLHGEGLLTAAPSAHPRRWNIRKTVPAVLTDAYAAVLLTAAPSAHPRRWNIRKTVPAVLIAAYAAVLLIERRSLHTEEASAPCASTKLALLLYA